MVSTPQSNSPEITDLFRHELFNNVSVNGTLESSSSSNNSNNISSSSSSSSSGSITSSSSSSGISSNSLYLRHNSTLDDLGVVWPGEVSVGVTVFVVMVSTCCVLGTLGNIPVLLVYCRKTDRRSTNTFIKVLAVIDLVVCALIMPYSLVMELHLITSDILCRLLEFVRHVSIAASNLTLVAIAVERYMAVCVITHRLTLHNVNQGMFVVMAVSVLMAVPSMGIFAVVDKEDVRNVSCAFPHDPTPAVTFCHFTTSLLGPALSTAYQAVLMMVFFLTFLVIVVLYTVVYSSLWKRAKRRTFMQSTSIEVDVTSSNDKPRSREGSSQDRDDDEEEDDNKQETTGGGRKATELQATDKLIGCSKDSEFKVSVPEQVTPRPEADRFRGWTNVEDAVRCMTNTQLRHPSRVRMNRHRRTARMLFLCSVVFLLTWLPFWVDVFNSSHILCLRYLFFLGNASNPLVYGISNSHFRQSLVRLLASFRDQLCGCKR